MRRVAAVSLQACVGAIGIVGTAAFGIGIGIGTPPGLQPALAGAHEGIRAFHRPHRALGAPTLQLACFGGAVLEAHVGPQIRAVAMPGPVRIHSSTTTNRRHKLRTHAQHATQRGTQAVTAEVHAHGMAQAFFGHGGAGMGRGGQSLPGGITGHSRDAAASATQALGTLGAGRGYRLHA